MSIIVSKAMSMHGWTFWQWIKGRKRSIVTALGTVIGYVIADSGLVAILAGIVVESAFAIGDYYFTEMKK